MKISLLTKVAVVQFGETEGRDMTNLSGWLSKIGIDWYYFDKTADRDFEIKDLKEHYDIVLEVL